MSKWRVRAGGGGEAVRTGQGGWSVNVPPSMFSTYATSLARQGTALSSYYTSPEAAMLDTPLLGAMVDAIWRPLLLFGVVVRTETGLGQVLPEDRARFQMSLAEFARAAAETAFLHGFVPWAVGMRNGVQTPYVPRFEEVDVGEERIAPTSALRVRRIRFVDERIRDPLFLFEACPYAGSSYWRGAGVHTAFDRISPLLAQLIEIEVSHRSVVQQHSMVPIIVETAAGLATQMSGGVGTPGDFGAAAASRLTAQSAAVDTAAQNAILVNAQATTAAAILAAPDEAIPPAARARAAAITPVAARFAPLPSLTQRPIVVTPVDVPNYTEHRAALVHAMHTTLGFVLDTGGAASGRSPQETARVHAAMPTYRLGPEAREAWRTFFDALLSTVYLVLYAPSLVNPADLVTNAAQPLTRAEERAWDAVARANLAEDVRMAADDPDAADLATPAPSAAHEAAEIAALAESRQPDGPSAPPPLARPPPPDLDFVDTMYKTQRGFALAVVAGLAMPLEAAQAYAASETIPYAAIPAVVGNWARMSMIGQPVAAAADT